MILGPFDPAHFAPVAALLAQEALVQAPDHFARQMALLGHPGPYQSSPSNSGLILDRSGHPLEHIMPTVVGGPARRQAAEITALALNRLCGFPGLKDQLDPDHINGVRAESARFLAQTGRLADAAE